MLGRTKTSKYSKMQDFLGKEEREMHWKPSASRYQFWYYRQSFILGRLNGISFCPDTIPDWLLCSLNSSLNRHIIKEWRLANQTEKRKWWFPNFSAELLNLSWFCFVSVLIKTLTIRNDKDKRNIRQIAEDIQGDHLKGRLSKGQGNKC